jgi:hypothetical protein
VGAPYGKVSGMITSLPTCHTASGQGGFALVHLEQAQFPWDSFEAHGGTAFLGEKNRSVPVVGCEYAHHRVQRRPASFGTPTVTPLSEISELAAQAAGLHERPRERGRRRPLQP